jgi:hypothetical protein
MVEVGGLMVFHYRTGSGNLVIAHEKGPKIATIRKYVPKMTLPFSSVTSYRLAGLSVL